MDSQQIQRLMHSINTYLDCKQRADQLWEQVEMHLQTSYLAESVGDTDLVPKHLHAVALLVVQATQAQKALQQCHEVRQHST